jgi:G3E family GTPase
MAVIPVTLITGFLGAGKSTLINVLLRDSAFAGTAVLINEFGEVAIDHDLVGEFSDETIVTTTGCLCCTASSEIKKSLFDLWDRRRNRKIKEFTRVVVETTGLADPVLPIAALLAEPGVGYVDRIVAGQFALARVITLFDMITGAATLDAHPEAQKQVALADVIVLTKTDLAVDPATKRDLERDRQRLRVMNPATAVLDRAKDWKLLRDLILSPGTYDLRGKGEDALAWLQAEAHHDHRHDHDHDHDREHPDLNRHGDQIRAHAITLEKPITPLALACFIDAMKLIAGPDLLRVKGLIALADDPDRPVVIHGVQHLIHPIDRLERWPSEDRRTRIVLIGRDLNVDALRTALTSLRPRRKRAVGAN